MATLRSIPPKKIQSSHLTVSLLASAVVLVWFLIQSLKLKSSSPAWFDMLFAFLPTSFKVLVHS